MTVVTLKQRPNNLETKGELIWRAKEKKKTVFFQRQFYFLKSQSNT